MDSLGWILGVNGENFGFAGLDSQRKRREFGFSDRELDSQTVGWILGFADSVGWIRGFLDSREKEKLLKEWYFE